MSPTKEKEILNGFISLIVTWTDRFKGSECNRYFVIGVDDFNRQEERSEYLYDLEKIAKTMYEYSQNSKVVKIELFMNGEIIGSLAVNH